MAARLALPSSPPAIDDRGINGTVGESAPIMPGTHDPNQTVKRTRRSPTFTSSPPTPAPELLCPGCDRSLLYRQTVISGIKPIERWDYLECRTCGTFVYRERTRKLRRAT